MRRLLIFGAGGHGRELAWVAQRIYGVNISVEFVVDRARYWMKSVDGHKVHLLDDLAEDEGAFYVVALGDPSLRKMAAGKMEKKFCSMNIIDSSVISSNRVSFGTGCVVMPGCILTSNIRIGAHVHLNIGCLLSHDTVIDEFSTLSPGVKIAGNVHIEEGVFMGIDSTVINGTKGAPLRIGFGSVVAAGACVTKDVPAYSMVAGVPAVVKRQLR